MPVTRLLLDTNVLGKFCHPNRKVNKPLIDWLDSVMARPDQFQVYVPAIVDYELRRKLIHLIRKQQASEHSLHCLNQLIITTDYLFLTDNTLLIAAELWADVRLKGLPTASPDSLEGDVILAAQAMEVGGVIVTQNRKHLARFVEAKGWEEIEI